MWPWPVTPIPLLVPALRGKSGDEGRDLEHLWPYKALPTLLPLTSIFTEDELPGCLSQAICGSERLKRTQTFHGEGFGK